MVSPGRRFRTAQPAWIVHSHSLGQETHPSPASSSIPSTATTYTTLASIHASATHERLATDPARRSPSTLSPSRPWSSSYHHQQALFVVLYFVRAPFHESSAGEEAVDKGASYPPVYKGAA